ncbi:MAG: hypothetical protein QXQ02_05570 [Halobacteria archaeon]
MQNSLSIFGSCRAQVLTLEGFFAAMLLFIAIHFILLSPSVIVPLTGQHLNVQLEQYGKDILLAMDNPDNTASHSLKNYIKVVNKSDLLLPEEMRRDLSLALPSNVMYNVVLRSINYSDGCISTITLGSKSDFITSIPPPRDSVTASHFLVIYDNELDSNSPFKATFASGDQPAQNMVHVFEVRLELWYI